MIKKVEIDRTEYIIDACQYANWDRKIFEQMNEGGVTCVNATIVYWETTRETLTRIGEWRRLFVDNADLIMPVYSSVDIDCAKKRGLTGIMLSFQHCSPIEEEIDLVEIMYNLGVRFMQLSYNNQSLLATGWMEREDTGITRFGREVIREMNRIGMVIDMSHSAERSTLEAIEFSERPIAITHANPVFWCNTERNKSDVVLKKLAESNGMIGFSLYPHHLKDGSKTTLEEFCNMIAMTADLIGTKNIGIGSDLVQNQPDEVVGWMRSGKWIKKSEKGLGWPKATNWFKDNTDFTNLIKGLYQKGFHEKEVVKIMGGNWFRFINEAFEPRQWNK